jgi:hypothetical protein
MESQKTQSIVVPLAEVKILGGPLQTMVPNEKELFNKIWYIYIIFKNNN